LIEVISVAGRISASDIFAQPPAPAGRALLQRPAPPVPQRSCQPCIFCTLQHDIGRRACESLLLPRRLRLTLGLMHRPWTRMPLAR
jgi:hypothetical protein